MTAVPRRRPSGRRIPRPLVGVLASVLLVLSAVPVEVEAASIADTVAAIQVANRAFSPNRDGVRDAVQLRFTLRRTATVTVRVLDRGGGLVRTLVSAQRMAAGRRAVSWNGRTARGRVAQNAGYRLRLTVTSARGTFSTDVKIVKARVPIYPSNPGAITVAIDPGHGGPDPGSIRFGLTEATANLDISVRLAAMLQGAGVRVVMTRTSDSRVNRRNLDWTADGIVNHRDELASRIEVANAAAADVLVSVHNNAFTTATGATEVWYTRDRPWARENRLLASLTVARLVTKLRTLRTSRWHPTDYGIKRRQFYILAPHRAGYVARPSLMPAIIGESLSMTHPYENRLLKSATARQHIAEAYYEAIARYLALRGFGARYELRTPLGPSLEAGSTGVAKVRVTNRSPRRWAANAVTLTARAVRAVPRYDGSNAAGLLLGSVRIRKALAAGEAVDVEVPFTVPRYEDFTATEGRILLKFDLVERGQRYANHGVVPLQVPLAIGGMLYSQDRDSLATSVRLGFTLRKAARVTWQLTDSTGAVVLSRFRNRDLRPGAYSFDWSGRNAAGRQVPTGTYYSRVTVRRGRSTTTIRRSIVNAPYRITPSDATPARGQKIEVTIVSAERLKANPVLVVAQPGRRSRTIRTVRIAGTTYRAVVTFGTGPAGTASLRVSGRDVRGGSNVLRVSLPLH